MRANLLVAASAALLLSSGWAAADTNPGADLAQRVCATCHGPAGQSVSPIFPRLAGQQEEYLVAQIKAFRDHSRADPHAQAFMWGMAAQLTDDVIKQIASYYASQSPVKGSAGDASEIAAGEKIYRQGIEKQDVPACQSCHLEKAEGAGAIPRLAGQQRGYLERQMESFAANLRANEIMHENSKNLTARQISDVAAFLSAQ